MVGICDGLNVLEIGSSSPAAAIAGMVLADAGARVLKVEPPEGDRLRTVNPNGFLVWSRGKESVVADLRTDAGRQAFLALADAADVVIEAFHPGTMEGWGLGPDVLRDRNPRLVHAHITAFGRSGPLAQVPGYDALVAAKAGVWARGDFGYREGGLMYNVPWGSFGAAMQTVAGIAGALLVRDRTGRGQELDTTLWGGLEPLDYFIAGVMQVMAKRAKLGATAGGAAHAVVSRYGVLLATRDGRFIQTSTVLPHQGRALSEIAGLAAELEEPRFAKVPMFDNIDDAQAWEDLLLEAFRKEDLSHWMPKLLANKDVAFEVALTSEEGTEHPQIVHNGDVVTIDDPQVGSVVEVGPIGHYSATPMHPSRSAPAIGANLGDVSASTPSPATGAQPGPHPLSGVTIVEFGYFYAMPYGVTMAASLGARVIKIEDTSGDPHRTSWGQDLASNKTTAGKESISLNLRTAEGRKVAQEIVARADVFINNFRSGVCDKLGLGEAELRAINPKLLYVHAAGYGSDGPYAHRALYAQAAQSVAGSFGRQVGYWVDPELNREMSVMELQAIILPRLAHVIDGDSNAALAVLAALALGVYHQQRTGEGQTLRTSMIGGNAWTYADDFCRFEGKVPAKGTGDEFLGTSALDHLYEAADRTWVCLHVETDAEFAALAEQLGGALTDPKFSTGAGRAEHDDELVRLLSSVFAAAPAGDWEAKLVPAGVGCVQLSLAGLAATTAFNPTLMEAGLTLTIDHPLFGTLVRAAPPVSFSESAWRVDVPCQRGEHNHAILAELGYDADAIAALEASGAVAAMTPIEPLPAEVR